MRVLITGHQGYIGGVLLPMLQHRGHQLVGCDVNYFKECLYLEKEVNIENLSMDIRDISKNDLKNFDAIIHLAGLSNDPLGNFNPTLTYDINQYASQWLAKCAKAAGVRRFLFASSCSNYGASDETLLDEQADFNPQTPYGQSKVAAETVICDLQGEGFEPCNLRAGTVYGLAPRIRFDLVVNNLTAFAVANKQVLLKSDGKAWRPLVHVSDVARAYVAALEAPAAAVSGESFNVGRTDQNYQIINVARKIQEIVPNCELASTDQPISDTRNYRVNCSKILKHLPDFKPQWTLDEGIQELYEAFTNSPVLDNEFEGQRFNRLAHLRQLIANDKLDSSLRYLN